MLQLPNELLRPIIEHFDDDKRLLCTVSLCSRAFRQEAQRLLFSNVTTLTNNRTHLKFMYTITDSPDRLALLVRAYKTPTACISSNLWITMCDGLKATRNLKHLQVSIVGFLFVTLDTRSLMFDGCTFQLERFEWKSNPRESDTLLQTFLPGQVGLKHLRMRLPLLTGSPTETTKFPTIESAVCPQLVSLEGSWDMVQAMLPKHKIETLMIIYDSRNVPSDTDDMFPLPLALKHIKLLRYPYPVLNSLGPDLVLLYCTSLTMLELPACTSAQEEETLVEMLLTMPSLHTFILARSPFIRPTAPNLPLIARIFKNSNGNMQYIYVVTKTDQFLRYHGSEGIGNPELVSENEVRKLWLPE